MITLSACCIFTRRCSMCRRLEHFEPFSSIVLNMTSKHLGCHGTMHVTATTAISDCLLHVHGQCIKSSPEAVSDSFLPSPVKAHTGSPRAAAATKPRRTSRARQSLPGLVARTAETNFTAANHNAIIHPPTLLYLSRTCYVHSFCS
jgi:hypothetical protein